MHLHKNVYVNIYSSIIQNNQNLKSNANISQLRNELNSFLIFLDDGVTFGTKGNKMYTAQHKQVLTVEC